jgi:adenosylhomocysteine nucleosidase
MAEAFPDPLVVMALEVESQGLFEGAGVAVLFTGLGKVNAALALTRQLAEYRHAGRGMPRVINFGTAGSRRFANGTVVACHVFVQRDMDVTGLGFERGTTPFEAIPPRLEFPVTFAGLPHGVCSTADSFETTQTELSCDVVDMEGYALAKVCWREQASFACAKFITDGADAAAATSWQSNLPKAAAEFLRLYRALAARR